MSSKVDIGDWTTAFKADHKGSGGTREAARQTFTTFQRFVNKSKAARTWTNELTPEKISSKQVRAFLEHCKNEILPSGKTREARVVQNIASHIRRAVMGAGRKDEFKNIRDPKCNWSSSRLGLDKASRFGNRSPMSQERYETARQILDVRERTALDLQRNLGLRMREAVVGGSLRTIIREINAAQLKGQQCAFVTVIGGTKGGRPRVTFIDSDRFEKVKEICARAISLQSETKGGFLIDKPTLAQAVRRYSNESRAAGLTGDDSSHGARRAFAAEQYNFYIEQGRTQKEALAALACDLGHGDGRGQWVLNNYLPWLRGGV